MPWRAKFAGWGIGVLFVGTERGVENRLVPAAGFRLEKIRVGGIKNLGIATRVVSFWRLVSETAGQIVALRANGSRRRCSAWAVTSRARRCSRRCCAACRVVVMEPNAVPGFTNRHIARWVKRALISFEETARFFPKGRTELTGLPVREEFFALPEKTERRVHRADHRRKPGIAHVESKRRGRAGRCFARRACRCGSSIRPGAPCMKRSPPDFARPVLRAKSRRSFRTWPAAFAQADLVVCRSGAGAVSELAAAGKPSVLIPFPFAADQHQLKNAEAFERAGAARLSLDRDWNGQRFFETVRESIRDRARLECDGRMRAQTGASRRGAAGGGNFDREQCDIDRRRTARNNKILKCFFHGSICTSRGSAESG